MDIQFSGAVDFSPLFSQAQRPGFQSAWKNDAANYQGTMLQNQHAILQPLEQPYDVTDDPIGFQVVGQNVDVMG